MRRSNIGRAAIRGGVGVAVVVGLLVTTASVALAHVTVQPGQAEQGGFATIAFQVPNERPNASTTKLKVQFPTDHPLAFVSVKPKAGWSYKVEKVTLPKPITAEGGRQISEVVSTITWEGGKIGPGEFDDFPVSVGTLPTDATSLAFPAIQTYDNGDEVAWIDKPTADGKEPEHPAPALKLEPDDAANRSSGGNTDGHGDATTDGTAKPTSGTAKAANVAASSTESAAASNSSSSSSSSGLAIAALAVALVAVVLAVVGIAGSRRTSK